MMPMRPHLPEAKRLRITTEKYWQANVLLILATTLFSDFTLAFKPMDFQQICANIRL